MALVNGRDHFSFKTEFASEGADGHCIVGGTGKLKSNPINLAQRNSVVLSGNEVELALKIFRE